MRFSIFSLVGLFVPVALYALAFAEHFKEPPEIEWSTFTVASMHQHLEEGRPVLVLGAPQGFIKQISNMAVAEFDSLQNRQLCNAEGFAMMKFEYTPWGPRDLSIQEEVRWMQKHAGYKEPWLVRVEPGGATSTMKHIISPGGASEFLTGGSILRPLPIYLTLAVISSVLWISGGVLIKANRRGQNNNTMDLSRVCAGS